MVVAVALVAVAGALVARPGGEDPAADVGIAPPDEPAAPRPTATREAPEPVPVLEPDPRLAALGGRVALARAGQVLVLDPDRVELRRVVGSVDVSDLDVVGAAGGSILLADGVTRYVVERDGAVTALGRADLFPAADGTGWWRVDDDVASRVGRRDAQVHIPAGADVVTEMRDGFVLRRPANDTLELWHPDGGARPLPLPHDATVVAVHPDRIAWHRTCPGADCALHVTEPASGIDLAVPSVLSPFTATRVVGRFSPDGSHLALQVAGARAPSLAELVLLDLAEGAVTTRRDAAPPVAPSSVAPQLRPLPFDFTRDGSRLVIADSAGRTRGVGALAVEDGRAEFSLEALAPVTSLVVLDTPRRAPESALATAARPPGGPATVAVVDGAGTTVRVFDLETASSRSVQLGVAGQRFVPARFGPGLVALAGGFLATDGGAAHWIPIAGEPVDLGPGHVVLARDDRAVGWVFTERTGGGYEVLRVDGATGATSAERPVGALPFAATGAHFVRTAPATFTAPGVLEVYDTRTGATRAFEVAAQYPQLVTAGSGRVVWYDERCYADGARCALHVVTLDDGTVHELAFDADSYAPPGVTSGEVVYLRRAQGIVRLELSTLAGTEVPGSAGAGQWTASGAGAVVFDRDGALYMWSPGLAEPVRVALGTFEEAGSYVVAVR